MCQTQASLDAFQQIYPLPCPDQCLFGSVCASWSVKRASCVMLALNSWQLSKGTRTCFTFAACGWNGIADLQQDVEIRIPDFMTLLQGFCSGAGSLFFRF